jgi:transcriptional regulator with XRE-family HTH domain
VRVEAQFDRSATVGKRRGAKRRQLRLNTEGLVGTGGIAEVIIHDLSATGLLLETSVPLAVDESIEVELPEANRARAKVVWQSQNLFGCQFSAPLPRAVLSAAQLLSSPKLAIGDQSHSDEPADDAAANFGKAIKQWRRENGLTAARFAERFGVSRPTVWAWESGKSLPRQSMLARLSKEMGLTAPNRATAPPTPPENIALQPSAHDTALARAVLEAKERVAAAAGTSADKVKLILEF